VGKVKVKISEDLIRQLLHLSIDNVLCDARFKQDCLELVFENHEIPEGLHEGYIETYYRTSRLVIKE
jgi:hypothetical protein